jgi:predicted regulator of Ras-like GTPase activity (Roadblock/LC7/MglB family)
VGNEVRISVPLKPILHALPPFQLTGDISGVPEDARLELPFSIVEPQLASGRVTIKPDDFSRALPAAYKNLFSSKEIAAPVALPLQDILKNLPAASLRMREDQEEQEKGSDFETPFSAKAQEDAKRFNFATASAPKPLKGMAQTPARPASAGAVPAPKQSSEVTAANVVPPAAPATQPAPEKTDEPDGKSVVASAGKMPGVKACAIMFGDGLSLAGDLPEEYEADGLCAMAPSLLERVSNHMAETKLGELQAMTLSCANAAVTFFMHNNLCLAALHEKAELAPDVRESLAGAVHDLAKKYSHPV